MKLANIPESDWRNFNKATAIICRSLVYLIETNGQRERGNKGAPEALLFDHLKNLQNLYFGEEETR